MSSSRSDFRPKEDQNYHSLSLTISPLQSSTDIIHNFETLIKRILELEGKKEGNDFKITESVDSNLETTIEVVWSFYAT